MAEKRTPAEIKRDEFLRNLAIDPAEGLRYWKRLQPQEQIVVVTYMVIYFGADFANHFKMNAQKHKRPDLVINVTNVPVEPHSLLSRGFRLRQTVTSLSRMQIWVHPGGSEVWLITAAKSLPPQPRPAAPPVHPDIVEIRLYVSQYSQRKDEMNTRARALESQRGSLSPQRYKDLQQEWWAEYESWNDEMDDILGDIIPNLEDDLTPDEQAQKNRDIQQLKKARELVEPPTDSLR